MRKQFQLVAVLIAALLTLASPAQSQNHWQLIRAEYGAGNQYRDVTARVQSLVRGDSLDVRVNNDTMGVDPAPGQHKTLRLQVRGLDGDIRQLNFSEGETARVQVMRGGGYGAGLQITHAEYGAGSKTRDVTSVLAAMIQGNSLRVRVTNDAMGGDPADEHHKVLNVSYVYNGRPGQVSVNEGDSLNLPVNPQGERRTPGHLAF